MEWLPKDTKNMTVVFGGNLEGFLPPYEEIPEEFKGFRMTHKWQRVASDWFMRGLKNHRFLAKDGIDVGLALRHLSACLSSWQPKHEHKIAGVAYLMSLWFDDVQYDNDSGARVTSI